jgi:uncharacterized protein (TIGR00730 family)
MQDELATDSSLNRPARDSAIAAFLQEYAPSEHQDLFAEMMVTICRLAREKRDRGELKILNSALKELRYAFKVFAPYRGIRKVSMFGSARTPAGHPVYVQAMNFAARMRDRSWMVITGAGTGIMGAGHGGAGKDASFGVAIRLPFEQSTNPVITDDPKLVNFKYFFTRKLIFLKEAEAIALFPGGFGTQDEGFEALTLIQTGKAAIVPVVMIDVPGGTYWQRWMEYITTELLRTNLISPQDLSLFALTDDVEQAVDIITRFYKRYHSSRYVHEKLVIRLNESLDQALMARLNGEFADIVAQGTIVQTAGSLPEEEGELADKARLVFTFNRHDTGRLRQLIDTINAA